MSQIKLDNDNYDLKFFTDELGELGLSPDKEQLDMFCRYYELLVSYNKVVNLTAITEFREVFVKHFVDSMSIVKTGINMSGKITLLDMGTGAGFPGLPIKIMFPEIEVVLVDSLQKRITFLETVISECGIKGITTVHSRAEDFCRTDCSMRDHFDVCVSRAVARLNVLEEYCLPYVKVGGHFISYKSGHCEDEIAEAEKAVKKLGGTISSNVCFDLPDSDISRCLIDTIKTKTTIKIYPRKAGTPAKEPIK